MSELPTQTDYAHASRGRRSTHHSGDDREQAILATAERLLQERPLADFSVDDLAKGAGISRPTFYFYFQSKNAVLLSLLDQMISKAHAALKVLRGKLPGHPATVWRDRIEAFFEVSGSHRAVAVAGAAAKGTNPEVRQLWSTLMQKWISYTTAAIQAERQRGAAPDTVPAADLSIALNMLNERMMAQRLPPRSPRFPKSGSLTRWSISGWPASTTLTAPPSRLGEPYGPAAQAPMISPRSGHPVRRGDLRARRGRAAGRGSRATG